MATPLVVISDGLEIRWAAPGCPKGSFFFYRFNTCSSVRTTRHSMHTSDIGWELVAFFNL